MADYMETDRSSDSWWGWAPPRIDSLSSDFPTAMVSGGGYARAKLANVLFALELPRRYPAGTFSSEE